MKITIKRIIACIFLFCLSGIARADFDFTNQELVNSFYKEIDMWSNATGVFYNNFTVFSSATVMIGSTITLKSNSLTNRRLTADEKKNRFLSFTMTDAYLVVENITFREGRYGGNDTDGGGAISHTGGGVFSLSGNSSFEYNESSVQGGAIYSSGSVSIDGTINFKSNSAGLNGGGAIFSRGNITFEAGSDAVFDSNRGSVGGALLSLNGSVTFKGGAAMYNNIAVGYVNLHLSGAGGAVYSPFNISFESYSERVIISSNGASGSGHGGALFAGGEVSFAGGALIEKNHVQKGETASYDGGAIYAVGNVLFSSASADIVISSNYASGSGGAIYSSSSVTFEGAAKITGNYTVLGFGGAIWAKDNIYISASSAQTVVEISSNSATRSGGALFSENALVSVGGYLKAIGNGSSENGGAIYAASVYLGNGGEILNSVAASSGGAIYIFSNASSNASQIFAIDNDVLFSGNKAADLRNDIFMDASNYNVTLELNAAASKSITLDGGIKSLSVALTSASVSKDGEGILYLNGDNDIDVFNVLAGTVAFGVSSSFKTEQMTLDKSFIDMRNLNASDNLEVGSAFISTANAVVYVDVNSDNGNSDLITAAAARIDGTVIKIGIDGIDANEKIYRIFSVLSGSGSITVDNTNGDFEYGQKYMTRVRARALYDGLQTYHDNWQTLDLEIKIDQLNALPGLTDNQLQNALALDKDYGTAKGDLFEIIDIIDRMASTEQKKRALNDLSAHIYANVITLPTLNWSKSNIFSRISKNYFESGEEILKRTAWAQGFIASDKYGGDVNSPGDFAAGTSGFQTGFDTMKNDRQIFGITVGYSDTDASQNDDKINMTAYNLGGYGAYFFDNAFDVKFMFLGARQNYSSERKIKYLERTAAADFAGLSVNASVLGTYDWYYKNGIYFKPCAGLDFSYVSREEFTENNANSADLRIYAGSYSRLTASAGFEADNGYEGDLKWHCGVKFNLIAAGSYASFEGKYRNTEHSLEIKGIENGIFNMSFGAGAVYDITEQISAYANTNAAFFGNQTAYYANIGINYKFSTSTQDFFDR